MSFIMFIAIFPQAQLSSINAIKTDVVKSLSLYYYTFVDIMDFKVRLPPLCSYPL